MLEYTLSQAPNVDSPASAAGGVISEDDGTAPPVHELEAAATPAHFSGRSWARIATETIQQAIKHRVPAQAAAVSFYGLLAFIPAVAAFGAAIGLLAGPDGLDRRLATLADVAPEGVLEMIAREAARFASGPPQRLLFSTALFSLFALGSMTSAVRSLMEGLNRAYGVTETRHWIRRRLISAAFAAGIAVAFFSDVALIIRSGDYLSREPDVLWPTVRLVLRWLSLFVLSGAALALLYRYVPDRSRARWRWVTPGSLATALVGLLVSAGVSVYLARFANYERTYGGLGTILGLALWMWSSMATVLLGAELNASMERLTSLITDVSGRDGGNRNPPPTGHASV